MVSTFKDNSQLKATLRQRRDKLAKLFSYPVLLWAGSPLSRNFPANRYPFRASSHFLYFAGLSLENAVIYLQDGKLTLLMDNSSTESTLWHGETPTREQIAETIGADFAYPLSELPKYTQNVASIAVQDFKTYQQQCHLLNRALAPEGKDLDLRKAIVTLRLCHDEYGLGEIKKAVSVSVNVHKIGMKATKIAKTEAEVRGAMEGSIIAHHMQCAYHSIVTVQGEVLHNERDDNLLQSGDLILADVGAETSTGYAADITRTWAVSGKFSATQRDIYDLVLAAHDQAIARIRSGVEYQEIHLLAASVIAQGLVDIGILKGNADELVERDAHAVFFPHGIGHLLGLDVHDMEDLGDLAGYEAGRERSHRLGLKYLRLHRPLRQGMVVTIEPGFYQIPALLQQQDIQETYQDVINWDKLAQFKDVRGIRIEDDVLVTETGAEVLSASLPTSIAEIEAFVGLSSVDPQ